MRRVLSNRRNSLISARWSIGILPELPGSSGIALTIRREACA